MFHSISAGLMEEASSEDMSELSESKNETQSENEVTDAGAIGSSVKWFIFSCKRDGI